MNRGTTPAHSSFPQLLQDVAGCFISGMDAYPHAPGRIEASRPSAKGPRCGLVFFELELRARFRVYWRRSTTANLSRLPAPGALIYSNKTYAFAHPSSSPLARDGHRAVVGRCVRGVCLAGTVP